MLWKLVTDLSWLPVTKLESLKSLFIREAMLKDKSVAMRIFTNCKKGSSMLMQHGNESTEHYKMSTRT